MHGGRTLRICGPLAVLILAALAFLSLESNGAEPSARKTPWTTSRVKGTPEAPPPYRAEVAYPHLSFTKPVDLTTAPGSNRLFVVEQAGKIYSFVDDPETKQMDLLVDLKEGRPEMAHSYALTFHPNFEKNRYCYVCYINGGSKPDGSVISRFTVSKTDPPTIVPDSEQFVIRWKAGGHNGCCLKFGPDGYLYISTGDGVGPSPPDEFHSGQNVGNLLSAVLRIDVDHADGDHNYRIPDDNPFVDLEGACPEIWAYGFRNPWRMSFDSERGDLWVGDVGWQLWEMIYRVEKGGNYGWSVMEGPQPALPEQKRGPTPILPPTVSHPHSEASSITGGLVYHGTKLKDLAGTYIYGDYQSGIIWGLRFDGKQVTWHEVVANSPLQLVAFAEDTSRELLLLEYERSPQIYRLAPNPASGKNSDFPRLLSETGLFTSTPEQAPAPGVVPYAINARHWADHTTSERWMAVAGSETIQLDEKGNWLIPDGSVVAKTVSIILEPGSPATKLETQILHREDGSWRPYSYRWNETQTDAKLVDATGASQLLKIIDPDAPGGTREQDYRFAARSECQLCHNPWVETKTTVFGVQTASALAINTLQLDRDLNGEPQLAALQKAGILTSKLPELPEAESPRFVDPYDTTADLTARVRSYLHVNCSHCHQPHAGGASTIELTLETPLDKTNAVNIRPTQGTFGISDAKILSPGDPLGSILFYRVSKRGAGRMPRLGSEEVDNRGVALIHEWISQLPRGDVPLPASHATTLAALESESPEARQNAIQELIGSTRGALSLFQQVHAGKLRNDTRATAIALTAAHPRSEVRDLFEQYIPSSERLKRLGSNVNVKQLLAMTASQDQGRELFFREGAVSCKNCHVVSDKGGKLGPDLSLIGKKYRRDELLTHLLEPSRFIDQKYIVYTAETTDGKVYSGLLTEKGADVTVLRDAQDKEIRLKNDEIELLVPQQKSLMPDLLLRDLTAQQAADLLAFLSSLK